MIFTSETHIFLLLCFEFLVSDFVVFGKPDLKQLLLYSGEKTAAFWFLVHLLKLASVIFQSFIEALFRFHAWIQDDPHQMYNQRNPYQNRGTRFRYVRVQRHSKKPDWLIYAVIASEVFVLTNYYLDLQMI